MGMNMGMGMGMNMGMGMGMNNFQLLGPPPWARPEYYNMSRFMTMTAPPMNMGMINSPPPMSPPTMNMGMMNSPPPMSPPTMNMGMMNSPPNNSMYLNNNNNFNNASFAPSLSNDDCKIKDIQAKVNTNEKDDIMKIINTQDFINGFWEDNEYTNIIKEKYKEEYNLLKGIKNKNITDKVAITILIIYFIEKEHPELLDELLMIIKKAKIFILNEAKETYENIIKEISIS